MERRVDRERLRRLMDRAAEMSSSIVAPALRKYLSDLGLPTWAAPFTQAMVDPRRIRQTTSAALTNLEQLEDDELWVMLDRIAEEIQAICPPAIYGGPTPLSGEARAALAEKLRRLLGA